MLPVLLWEVVWKCIWGFNFAMRMWLDGGLDEYATGVLVAVSVGVVIVLLMPWTYIFRYYLQSAAESWTSGVDLVEVDRHA